MFSKIGAFLSRISLYVAVSALIWGGLMTGLYLHTNSSLTSLQSEYRMVVNDLKTETEGRKRDKESYEQDMGFISKLCTNLTLLKDKEGDLLSALDDLVKKEAVRPECDISTDTPVHTPKATPEVSNEDNVARLSDKLPPALTGVLSKAYNQNTN